MKLPVLRLTVRRIVHAAVRLLRCPLPWLVCVLALLPSAALGAENPVAQKGTPREVTREAGRLAQRVNLYLAIGGGFAR